MQDRRTMKQNFPGRVDNVTQNAKCITKKQGKLSCSQRFARRHPDACGGRSADISRPRRIARRSRPCMSYKNSFGFPLTAPSPGCNFGTITKKASSHVREFRRVLRFAANVHQAILVFAVAAGNCNTSFPPRAQCSAESDLVEPYEICSYASRFSSIPQSAMPCFFRDVPDAD